MNKSIIELTDEAAELLDLGVALGQNQAFSLVAGRCSAAQAATLLRLRQEKKYLKCAANWREFCPKYLKISGSEADRIIRIWEEFGAAYFELAQLMRISPETYRAIEPAVKDGALIHNGEAIEFDVENSGKLAAAVAQLRDAGGGKKPAKKSPPHRETHVRLADLDRRCTGMIAEFQEISRTERSGENWILFVRTLTRVRGELSRIERENGL
jgi:hypothetical protein